MARSATGGRSAYISVCNEYLQLPRVSALAAEIGGYTNGDQGICQVYQRPHYGTEHFMPEYVEKREGIGTGTDVELHDPTRDLLSASLLNDAVPRAVIAGQALILRADFRTDRTGSTYCALTLHCVDGSQIQARWWRISQETLPRLQEGSVWRLAGILDSFQGVRYLNVTGGASIPDANPDSYCARSRRSRQDLEAALHLLIAELDEEMASLVRNTLVEDTYERYCTWPAAQTHHGATLHGLLAHSVAVTELALALAEQYAPHGLVYDRQVVIASCLLHDVGKTRTLPRIAGTALPGLAKHLDHVTLGAMMVRAAAEQGETPINQERLESILHAILAHHGRKEWGAAIEPQTTEAWLVHLADLAEARLWGFANAPGIIIAN